MRMVAGWGAERAAARAASRVRRGREAVPGLASSPAGETWISIEAARERVEREKRRRAGRSLRWVMHPDVRGKRGGVAFEEYGGVEGGIEEAVGDAGALGGGEVVAGVGRLCIGEYEE
jgi:hypothetical protein